MSSYSDLYGSYGMYNTLYGISSIIVPALIISFILALLVAIFFLPKRNRGKFSPFLTKVYNFLNFNVYWITWILKVFFMTLSIFLLVMGVYVMFALNFWAGLVLILSILLVRVVYEGMYAILSIRDNVEEMNRRQGGYAGNYNDNPHPQPESPRPRSNFREFAQNGPQRPEQSQQEAPVTEPLSVDQIKTEETPSESPAVCANCGAELRPGAVFCANCGSRVQ